MIERDEIVGERLRQLDRYKDAVRRAEALRDAGKLPKNFDWSRLEDIDEEDLEDLVSREIFARSKALIKLVNAVCFF